VFIWLLRRSRPYFDRVSGWPRLVLLAIRAGLLLLLVSVVANLFGYVALSTALKVGVIISCYLALFLYTVRQIAIDSLPLILGTPPVALLGAVRLHKRTIQSWLSRLLALAALFVWFYAALGLFSIRKGVSDAVGASLTQPLLFGRVSLSLQDVLFFLLTLFAGITLARVVRALLEEDVLPHLSLRRGVPNTISTLTHFGLATAGFFLSLAVVGVEFSRLTVLTGALGIGVGFGLQTIVSNFASGLMLLLVRPIIVGDVVEAEGLAGEVKRIGLYSSTVRTAQGAEVIVPNTNLVIGNVINWTLSERNRRVDLQVGVAYGTDLEAVIKLLVEVATSHPNVVRQPAPVALFTGFGESSLDFELRFWAPHVRTYQQLKSEVAIHVWSAFREAGIEIPFPQREVLLKSPDAAVEETPLLQEQSHVESEG
jgi:potassium efflux system protein